jgi:bacillithiol biosynthesis deacetylase BshB1
MSNVKLLVFGAHPDDAEIGMGGTIAKHTAAGEKVIMVDLTLAELSSNGTVEIRQQEAEMARQILGVTERINLKFPDRGLSKDSDKIKEISRLIRYYRPEVVCSPYEIDRHPDHGACTELVTEALFNAKIHKYDVGEAIPAYDVRQHYFYFINGWADPSVVVDISTQFPMKMEAIAAYGSQFGQSAGSVATPLNQGYIDMVTNRDRYLGQKSGCIYAEGFIVRSPLTMDRLGRMES